MFLATIRFVRTPKAPRWEHFAAVAGDYLSSLGQHGQIATDVLEEWAP